MILRNTSEIIIKPRLSWVIRIGSGLSILLLLVFGAWYAYDYGLRESGFESQVAQRAELELILKIQKLEAQNESLAASLAITERQIQVDKSAYKDLKDSLGKSAREIAELNKEMNFYRSILSPDNNQAGIQIQELRIERTAKARQYRYTVVMIQALKHQKNIKGKVRVSIQGVLAGKQKTLSLSEIGSPLSPLDFKYFQNLEGLFTLPENFMPTRVKISVKTERKNAPPLERWYPWRAA